MRFAAVALLSAACAPSLLVSRLPSPREVEQVNEEIGGKDGTAVLSGAAVDIADLKFGRETTEWREGSKSRRVPTAAIERIEIKSQAGGAAAGAGIGAIPGVLTGLIVGGTLKSGGDASATPYLIALGIAAGATAVGALIGAAIGSRTTVEFCERGWFASRIPASTVVFSAPDGRSPHAGFVEDASTLCLDTKPAAGFHRIRLANGRIGYVVDSSLEETPPVE